MPRIVIGGDICPTRYDEQLFTNGDARGLFGDILDDLTGADLAIANLETPLIARPSPIQKSGAVFGWPSESINGIKAAGIRLLNLGNNHILDHGEEGLANTIRVCEEAGLDYVGAGKDIAAALMPRLYALEGRNVAVFSFAEEEFSIATDKSPGAAPLNPIDFVRVFREYRSRFDFSIIMVHGGKEHYPYPTPNLQKICRFLIEEGADAVLCQHSHCPGGYEEYRTGVIFYGQGNFIFNRYPRQNPWLYEGYLVSLQLVKKGFTWEIIPFRQIGSRPGLLKLKNKEYEAFCGCIDELAEKLTSSDFVEKKWQEFCGDKKELYLGILKGYGPLMRRIDAGLKLTNKLYSTRKLRLILNIVRCQSHREVLVEILRQRLSR